MRKCNTVVSILIIIMFLIHGIAGAFNLFGLTKGGNQVLKVISYSMLLLIIIHIIIGIKLTIDSIIIGKRSGKFYFRENALFWIRRITGFAMVLLIVCHVHMFTNTGKVFRLNAFREVQLVLSILLVLTVLVHILTNIRPLLISFGISSFRIYIKDILLIISIILVVAALAFVVYYLRWNILWRYR